jgi:hypothetical protein
LVGESLFHVPHQILQRRPYLPDLLKQPEFLLVPKFGQLIAVYVMTQMQALTWRTTLAAVEDLFELKQACGESTVAIAVLKSSNPRGERESILLPFLNSLFDGFVAVDSLASEEVVFRLRQTISETRPRDQLFPLWRSERIRVSENLSRFSEERYASFVDQSKIAIRAKAAVLREVKAALGASPALRMTERFRVRSPKEALAGLAERNRFVFDIGVESSPEEEITPLDVAVLGRYGSRGKLRYLMTKARLASYAPWDGGLELRQYPRRPVLVVSGNIAGPSHDPFRYVRALVSVGWELVHATEDSLQGLLHGNV